jgi:hypothetical protein
MLLLLVLVRVLGVVMVVVVLLLLKLLLLLPCPRKCWFLSVVSGFCVVVVLWSCGSRSRSTKSCGPRFAVNRLLHGELSWLRL